MKMNFGSFTIKNSLLIGRQSKYYIFNQIKIKIKGYDYLQLQIT